MNPSDYTEAQKKDINERTKKAAEFLKKLDLQPACFVSPHNSGDDVFAFKVIGYLQDLKYSPTVSPLQNV